MRWSRRKLLANLGVSAAMLPLLEPEYADASCVAAPPRRVIFMVFQNGLLGWSSGGAEDFELGGALTPFEPYRDRLIVVDGVRYQNLMDTPNPTSGTEAADNFGHGAAPALLTASRYAEMVPGIYDGGGISLDQHISAELARQGVHSGPALHFGIRHSLFHFSWRGASDPVPPDSDPAHVFDTFFAQALDPDPAYQRLRARRRTIVDVTHARLAKLCKTLGGADRQRCEAHLASLHELEGRLRGVAVCEAPDAPTGIDPLSNDDVPAIFAAQIDNMVAALASDVTRAGVITYGDHSCADIYLTWLGFQQTPGLDVLQDPGNHHGLAHRAGADPMSEYGLRKIAVDTWFMEQVVYLLDRLQARQEGDGTMLDNTVVVVVNSMNNGAAHTITGVPMLLFGDAGGYLRTGRRLDVDVPHTDVLNVIAEAMGASIEGWTQPEYRGTLDALKA